MWSYVLLLSALTHHSVVDGLARHEARQQRRVEVARVDEPDIRCGRAAQVVGGVRARLSDQLRVEHTRGGTELNAMAVGRGAERVRLRVEGWC